MVALKMHPSQSVNLVLRFWREVWSPPYNIDAIDELLTEDFSAVNAGVPIQSRAAFKEWAGMFRSRIGDVRLEPLDTFANVDGSRVASRWHATGRNNGMFGLQPNGEPVAFTGISIWEVRGGKLVSHWFERSALELFQKLTAS